MDGPDDALAELAQRLRRYPRDRYPVQHATARFHLGTALVEASRPHDAVAELQVAAELFPPERLPVEHAKATNMLGVALRLCGRPAEAAQAFARAAAGFTAPGQALERGAALFNLGLVRRDQGDLGGALDQFEQARALLDETRVPAQAAAAAREAGSALLAQGDVARATAALARSVELATRAGDRAGVGLAANALGLAHLAAGRPGAAIDALTTAVAAHPRSVRREGYAMAKANLALAYEQAGHHARARLAAGQALGTPGAPAPVAGQVVALLDRLGPATGDLHLVLDQEPPERWLAVVREELLRWSDADEGERRAAAAAWVDGQLARSDRAAERAEAWLGAVAELPPASTEALVRSVLLAAGHLDDEDGARFRRQVGEALVRFPVPQWLRLKDTFNRIAVGLGQEAGWG